MAALRVALRERGSNLLLRMGPAAAEVPAAAELVGANRIIAEEEVEHRRAPNVTLLPALGEAVFGLSYQVLSTCELENRVPQSTSSTTATHVCLPSFIGLEWALLAGAGGWQ